jgi:flagellar basal-body rod protein FlgC
MSIFGAIGIASTGLTLNRKWLDAVSDNISNINTVKSTNEAAYQAKYMIATEAGDNQGVMVAGVALGSAEGRLTYQPDHPLADAGGYVRLPDTDLSSQMTQLIMAQRAYEANAAVVDRAKATYEAALAIGR